MKRAETSSTPVLNATLDGPSQSLSAQLFYILVMTCKGVALTKVINAGPSEGLEAWRLLVQHYEPSSHTRHAGMLLGLLSFDFSGDVIARLETFERDALTYTQSSGQPFDDSIKVGIVLRNLPEGNLKQHLIMNADRLATFKLLSLIHI